MAMNGNPFRAKILEKKKSAVKVGVFDEHQRHIDTIEISSVAGVSDEVHKGQTITI